MLRKDKESVKECGIFKVFDESQKSGIQKLKKTIKCKNGANVFVVFSVFSWCNTLVMKQKKSAEQDLRSGLKVKKDG